MLIPRAFLTCPPGSPVKESPLQVPLTELPQTERRFTFRAPFIHAPFPEPPSLSLKIPSKRTPPQVPQRGPYGKRHPFLELSSTRPLIIHLSLKFSGKWAPLCVPQQGRYGERCSASRANGLFIHLRVYQAKSPVKEHSPWKRGNHTVTIHGAPSGRKAYIQWGAAWLPQVDRLQHCCLYSSAMQPLAWYLPPWLG